MSGSLFNAGMASRFSGEPRISIFTNTAGVVYSPAHTQINCVYAGDGGSRAKDDGCGQEWCSSRQDAWCDGRPHRAWQLVDVLRGQSAGSYNEVIIDAAYLDAHLPQAVEAFFYLVQDGGSSFGEAMLARRAFVEKYNLNPADFPLLSFDIANVQQPFRQTDRPV